MLTMIKQQAAQAMEELLQQAQPKEGSIVVVGCSSSEILGEKIGSHSSMEAAQAVWNGIMPVLDKYHVYLAAQCCEHLNRAIIMERQAAEKYGYEEVNVVPQMKAGGSFATTAYAGFQDPVAVEEVKAVCGMDIGGTLIGMHLKRVAVPVRLSVKKIGEAVLICARTRPKFIGGERARYNEKLM
jgi:uncharacterized protein (TIGR01440 family)